MKLHSILLGWKRFPTKPCVSPQVFHGGMHLMRCDRVVVSVKGVKPSRQCSKTGSLKPGGALELEDMVKLNKCSQASSPRTSHTRLIKAWAKRRAVESGLSNVARRDSETAGVVERT